MLRLSSRGCSALSALAVSPIAPGVSQGGVNNSGILCIVSLFDPGMMCKVNVLSLGQCLVMLRTCVAIKASVFG